MNRSLCPVCFKEIVADVTVGNHVWMIKECPEHGRFSAMVERDPHWYFFCKKENSPCFYEGLMVDVTNQCNIKCKYCYHDNSGGHRSVEDVINEIQYYGDKAPFILTGGEPTLHPELADIIQQSLAYGQTVLLTNGIKLCDEEYLQSIIDTGILDNGGFGLSFHKESNGKDLEFIDICRNKGVLIGTAFYVIDSVDQMQEAVKLLEENQDVLREIRIKAASNLWNESKVNNKIFVSDMFKQLVNLGETSIDTTCNNKLSYANTIHKGLKIKLISWYDKYNIDLDDINCDPWYLAKNGTLNNLVTTGILNESTMHIEIDVQGIAKSMLERESPCK